jgi:hypothetical protein
MTQRTYEARFVVVSHTWGQDDFRETRRVPVAMARFTARGPGAANVQCCAIAETIPGNPDAECFEVYPDGRRAKYSTADEYRMARAGRRA